LTWRVTAVRIVIAPKLCAEAIPLTARTVMVLGVTPPKLCAEETPPTETLCPPAPAVTAGTPNACAEDRPVTGTATAPFRVLIEPNAWAE
jgi:hypothetical protein